MADPRYDPMGEVQGPLPIPPSPGLPDFTDENQLGTSGGAGPLPISPAPSRQAGGYGGGLPIGGSPYVSPDAGRISELRTQLRNPIYRFGSALAGSNPAAEELKGLQGSDLLERHLRLQQEQTQQQVSQFLTTKRLNVADTILKAYDTIARLRPDQRAFAMQQFGPLVNGLAKEVGYEVPAKFSQTLGTAPGVAGKWGSVVMARFGGDPGKVNAVMAQLEDLEPPQIADHIEKMYKAEVESAIPKVQTYISAMISKIRADPAMMSRLGLLDDQGKPKPIPGALIERAASSYEPFQSNVHQAAVQAVLSDPKYTGFLANRGIQAGEADAAAQKTLAETLARESTPGGQAALAKTAAELGEATARTAQVKQDTATGKVVPIQQGGGVATVKPQGIEIVQAPGAKIADVSTIRKDFETQAKSFVTVRENFNRLVGAASSSSPGGDLVLTYSLIKLLDPTSTVMLGEKAGVENARGVPDAVIAKYNALLGGGNLAPNQRADFVKQAGKIMDTASDSHKKLEDQYRGIAERAGVNPADVVVDFMGNLRTRQKSTGKTPEQRILDKAGIPR